MNSKRLIISGRVQGVGYREWMVRKARDLGLSGWVRNRIDGSVEALVAGDTTATVLSRWDVNGDSNGR